MCCNINIKVKRLHPDAALPKMATAGSAGSDLYACVEKDIEIAPGATVLVPTGLAAEIPEGYAAFIFARSGLGIKHNIVPANCVGVIDSDYRGEIKVGLINQSQVSYTVQPRDRIAQMVILPVQCPTFTEVDALSDTERAGGGFGSTKR